MNDIKIKRINESYYSLETDVKTTKMIRDFLKVENPNAYFDKSIQYGLKDKYTRFYKSLTDTTTIIYTGHLNILKRFGVEYQEQVNDISDDEILQYIDSVKLPFKPYDYQIDNIKLALRHNRMMFKSCTSSGKSLSISLILNFFRLKGLRGVLIVPNINLLTQFKSDIESYGLKELSEQTLLLGDGNESDFSTCLTITTWQSMTKEVDNLNKLNLDFIICDEAHRMASECTSDIIKKSINTKIKLGFTGTLPEDPIAKMTLIGLFGLPKTIITASELIDRGLATPVYIKTLILNYNKEDKIRFKNMLNYQEQLGFIKEHQERTETIVKIATKFFNENKNVLVLFQHTEHGKDIYKLLINTLYHKKIEESDIVGKDSIEFQKEHKVLFMNGEQSGKIREEQRNFMEQNKGTILVGNFSVMSTGINIKQLHVLIFASPLKAFTTISQSLGRLMRKHSDKKESIVIDIVDNFGLRKTSGIFYKQYQHRLSSSYIPEEFSVTETMIDLK